MKTGTTTPNRLLRLDPSVYNQFAATSDHIDTVRAVTHHIAAHLGSVQHIFRGKAKIQPQIDLLAVPPTPSRNYYTLVTSGMSDQPMTTPTNLHQYRFAELYIHAPVNWNYDRDCPDSEAWPIELLLTLAQLPHTTASWLGYGHNMAIDSLCLGSNATAFKGALLTSSLHRHEQFQTLQASPGKRIYFYNVCPLHGDEFELVQLAGPTYMEDLLISQGWTGAFDVQRPSVIAPESPESKTKTTTERKP